MAKPGTEKTCKAYTNNYSKCGTRFTVKHIKQKFCSDACRKRHNRKLKERQCKKERKANDRALEAAKKSNLRITAIEGDYQKILSIYREIITLETPIDIPEEKSSLEFSYGPGFLNYTQHRTAQERKERHRKEFGPKLIKQLEFKVPGLIKKLIDAVLYPITPEDCESMFTAALLLDKVFNIKRLSKMVTPSFESEPVMKIWAIIEKAKKNNG